MTEPNDNPQGTPPAPATQDGKKKGLFYYGHPGRYGAAAGKNGMPKQGMSFGETIELTAAELKKLPPILLGRLVAADKWDAHVSALKKSKVLGKGAKVPGTK